MIPTVADPPAQQFVGIDLGTTNSALAWCDSRGPIHVFEIPQLAAPGEVARFPTLPSFLYFPTDPERQAHAARLPWNEAPDSVAGVFARDQGALVPNRQISSAKSWLANSSVDRTAALLPWGFDDGPRLSPVEASARLLAHLREAWNHEAGSSGPGRRLEQQSIVLTVPASFDEEARELTVQAAHAAGLPQIVLIEEPIAALYAWIAANRRSVLSQLPAGAQVLVCDVGGGTTDFSLLRTTVEGDDLRFERIAIGEHLLLGGDNLDLALAALVEKKLVDSAAPKLSLGQRQSLRRKCSVAKEQLLSGDRLEHVRITILGAGRGVVAGGMTMELSRDEVVAALADGFLPLSRADDLPARDRRVGLRELGLPYEAEPAITRHLAAFLARAGREAGGGMASPAAVLFNGGFFAPALARTRVLDALESWCGARPALLENDRPEAAVAVGAAFYARLRHDPAAARRLLIRAGSARSYYVGVQSAEGGAATTAVCVMPRGTQEGTTFVLDHAFSVTTNQPVSFALYSSIERHDALNDLVRFGQDNEVHRHAPLVTVMRYGKRSRRVPLGIRLRVVFTETGTLELWCESRDSEHRWRLAFNLRTAEADPLDVVEDDASGTADGEAQVVVTPEALDRATALIRQVFRGSAGDGDDHPVAPEALVGEIERVIGFGKQAWPLGTIRALADALIEVADGRSRGTAFEVRWLNLTGFCMRPGFGAALDAWRVSEVRKVYAAGLAFPRDIQGQVEWLVLWQRVGAGFNGGQQRELAQRVAGQLGLGQKKTPRLNTQIEREAWRLLASLERLDGGQRVKLGDQLLDLLQRDPRNGAWLWSIGRLGARVPLYGPLSSVIPPPVAERWTERLTAKPVTSEVAAAVLDIAARTDDPARDVSDAARERALAHLRAAGVPEQTLQPLLAVTQRGQSELGQTFGESLPHGLRLER